MAAKLLIRRYSAFSAASRARAATFPIDKWCKDGYSHHETSTSEMRRIRVFSKDSSLPDSSKKLSNKEKMKILVRDYGATAVIFHVSISLTSLGLCYLLVSYGVDMQAAIAYLGFKQSSKIVSGTGTFVVAYGVHKVFAPVRIAITAASTPLIVRYMRNLGWLKKPSPEGGST